MDRIEIITEIHRIPFVIPTDASLKQKFTYRLLRSQQKDIWRTVCKYFAEGNGVWEETKQGLDDETEVEITYLAKDAEDAERELDVIKNKAFRYLGQATLQRLKRRFKVDKKLQDDNPNFEKLRNNLQLYQIFLDVKKA